MVICILSSEEVVQWLLTFKDIHSFDLMCHCLIEIANVTFPVSQKEDLTEFSTFNPVRDLLVGRRDRRQALLENDGRPP